MLKTLPDGIAHTCVTSPPYWRLRDYGTGEWEGGDPECDHVRAEIRRGISLAESSKSTRGGGHKAGAVPKIQYTDQCGKCDAVRIDEQLGLEETPEEYVERVVEIFREVRRVLRDDGTVWLNLGDTYAAYWGDKYGQPQGFKKGRGQDKNIGDAPPQKKSPDFKTAGFKPKDLVGIPWMVAFALRADGWYLRQDIIWHKPNPMPESVRDRCTKSHEYIFLLSKSPKYYYDAAAIKDPLKEKTFTTFGTSRKVIGDGSGLIKTENYSKSVPVRRPKSWKSPDGWDTGSGRHGAFHKNGREKGKYTPGELDDLGANKKSVWDVVDNFSLFNWLLQEAPEIADKYLEESMGKKDVWTVASKPYPEAHFATFPDELIKPCILAGAPEGGIVLDPFVGSGTTPEVALRAGRRFIAIELKGRYIKDLAHRRIQPHINTLFS